MAICACSHSFMDHYETGGCDACNCVLFKARPGLCQCDATCIQRPEVECKLDRWQPAPLSRLGERPDA